MEKPRSTASMVILVILAFVLLVLSLTGKASDFISTLLKWLLGAKMVQSASTTKDKNNGNNSGSGGGGTKVPVTVPAKQKDTKTQNTVTATSPKANGNGSKIPLMLQQYKTAFRGANTPVAGLTPTLEETLSGLVVAP